MRIIVNDKKTYSLMIGRAEESKVEYFEFDISEWIDKYGDGQLYIFIKRPGDSHPYFKLLETETNVAVWTITKTETKDKGYGEVQLSYHVDDKVKKSPVYKLNVFRSITDATDPPDPYDDWMDSLVEMTADVTEKVGIINQKASDFNTNATNKTKDFNDNYTEKKGIIDQTFGEVSNALRDAITVTDDGQGHITLIIGGGSNGDS